VLFIHMTVKSLTSRVEGFVHKLHIDSFFSSPDLFDGLHMSHQLLHNCQRESYGMLGNKTIKLK
jgi:hypothetical protein